MCENVSAFWFDIPVLLLLNRGTGREGGGSGGGTKPRPKTGAARLAHPLRGAEVKSRKKPSAAQFARPLRGAEVLAHAICSEKK